MRPADRRVVSLPLTELWDDAGTVEATRLRDLDAPAIADLLRREPIRFAVADVRLTWVPVQERFAFWKSEVRDHVCAGDSWFLDDYPGEYCYVASEWRLPSGEAVVLLEKSH